MKFKQILALSGAAVLLVAAPVTSASGAGTRVSVRVEGKNRTLLADKVVQTRSGSITKGGAPSGACLASSGQGALDVATHGRWSGKFSTSLGSYFVTKILGETENGPKYYWSIYVNNRPAATGGCGIKLHPGDHLLFAATVYPEYPIAIQAPRTAKVGKQFNVKVVGFNAKGKSKPLAGAHVTGAGQGVVTNSRGIAHVVVSKAGTLKLGASDSGYVRAAQVRVRVTG
jgi:Domain of unknown function (DUF4430)